MSIEFLQSLNGRNRGPFRDWLDPAVDDADTDPESFERHGVTEAEFRACLSDPAQSNALNARVEAASARGVTGTPTFFVNGEMLVQPSPEQVESRVQAAVAAKAK